METEILYVSPHLDDVLLSMAQNIKNEIANNANVTIATFFSEGNTATRSLYESRRKDDVCAISKIGAKALHMGFTDSYFRDSRFCNYSSIMFHKECTETQLFNDIQKKLRELLVNGKYTICYIPLGVGGHVDHNIIFHAGRQLAEEMNDIDFRFYADMPYALISESIDFRIAEMFGYKNHEYTFRPLLDNNFHFLKTYCNDDADRERSSCLFKADYNTYKSLPLTHEGEYFPVKIVIEKDFDKAELIATYKSELPDLFGNETNQINAAEQYFMFQAKNNSSIRYVKNNMSDSKDYCARIIKNGKYTIMQTDTIWYDDTTKSLYNQVYFLFEKLRVLGCMYNLAPQGYRYCFQAEDIFEAEIFYSGDDSEGDFLKRFIPRLTSPDCKIRLAPSSDGRLGIRAKFLLKAIETPDGKKYHINEQGTIDCESFEVHVSEHCNLKCKQCCNSSPFNKPRFLSPEEVRDMFTFVKANLNPDVIKISGGEPMLNPHLGEIINIIKDLFPKTPLRITSNGLLFKRLKEEDFSRLDQLWISNYSSMPVPDSTIEKIRNLAQKYEIVLNIKEVQEFSNVISEEKLTQTKAEDSFRNCWMRHRCLIIRNNRFYLCTRAAYIDSYLKTRHNLDTDYSVRDGILLNDPDFKNKALELLNRNKPINTCVYCFGNTGSSFPSTQMKM